MKLALVGFIVVTASVAQATEVDYRLNTSSNSWALEPSTDGEWTDEVAFSLGGQLPGDGGGAIDEVVNLDGSWTGESGSGAVGGGADSNIGGSRSDAVAAPLPTSGLLGLGGLVALAARRRRLA